MPYIGVRREQSKISHSHLYRLQGAKGQLCQEPGSSPSYHVWKRSFILVFDLLKLQKPEDKAFSQFKSQNGTLFLHLPSLNLWGGTSFTPCMSEGGSVFPLEIGLEATSKYQCLPAYVTLPFASRLFLLVAECISSPFF